MGELQVSTWFASSNASSKSLHVTKPREVTCYSRSSSREVQFGSREQLKPFRPPRLPADLNHGFETFVAKPEDDVGLEPVLQALLKCSYDLRAEADIVTFRNNLNKIGLTPYEPRNAWEVRACKVQNITFLDIVKLPEPEPDEKGKRFMYYGYRFEQICTQDPTNDEPINANEEFCAIIRLRIGTFRILLSAEIDCEGAGDASGDATCLSRYLELKTCRKPDRPHHFRNLARHRYLKYWLQSYLAGVQTIYLGFRDDRGSLLTVEKLATRDLPKKTNEWDPFVCINFIHETLQLIQRSLNEDGEVIVRYSPENQKVGIREYVASSDGPSFRDRIKKLVEGKESKKRKPDE